MDRPKQFSFGQPRTSVSFAVRISSLLEVLNSRCVTTLRSDTRLEIESAESLKVKISWSEACNWPCFSTRMARSFTRWICSSRDRAGDLGCSGTCCARTELTSEFTFGFPVYRLCSTEEFFTNGMLVGLSSQLTSASSVLLVAVNRVSAASVALSKTGLPSGL